MWGLGTGHGSDHDDTPQLKIIRRHDARITDLCAFRWGDKLVQKLRSCLHYLPPPLAGGAGGGGRLMTTTA
jgi:hypothetical protein